MTIFLASLTLYDIILFFYSKRLYFYDFVCNAFMLYISLLFSAGSKSTENKFRGCLVVMCCTFIMFRTLCPSSNSSCLISSVSVE